MVTGMDMVRPLTLVYGRSSSVIRSRRELVWCILSGTRRASRTSVSAGLGVEWTERSRAWWVSGWSRRPLGWASGRGGRERSERLEAREWLG